MKFQELIEQLRRRGVIKVASIYAVTAAGIIQVLTATAPFLGIPENLVTVCIVLSLIFFPVAVFLSWKYEVVPEKQISHKKGKKQSPGQEKGIKKPMSLMTLAKLIVPLIVGISFMVWVTVNWLKESYPTTERIRDERIAVLKFVNGTGEESLDYLGKMAALLISHSLSNTGQVELRASTLQIGDQEIDVLMSKFGYGLEISRQSGVKNLITGQYFQVGDSLQFLSQLVDSRTGQVLNFFEEVWTPRDNPWKGIETIRQHILGFWITKDNPAYFENFPRADVYEEYTKASQLIEKDYSQALLHLDKCLSLDSSFIRAYILKLDIYKHLNEFQKMARLLQILGEKELDMEANEKNLYQHFKAFASGNNLLAFEYYKREYEMVPKDFFVNTRATIMAINLINDPSEVLKIARKIDYNDMDFNKCPYCLDRINAHITALLDLGRLSAALKLVARVNSEPIDMSIKELEVRVLARLLEYNQIEELLQESKNQRFNYSDGYYYLHSVAATEFALIGNHELSEKYSRIVIDAFSGQLNDTVFWENFSLGRSLMINGNYDLAESKYRSIFTAEGEEWKPFKDYLIAQIGCAAAFQNQTEEAVSLIDSLSRMEGPYDYGAKSYFQAQIWTSLGENSKAIESLQKSIEEGRQFYQFRFLYDPAFIPLQNDQEFLKILDRT